MEEYVNVFRQRGIAITADEVNESCKAWALGLKGFKGGLGTFRNQASSVRGWIIFTKLLNRLKLFGAQSQVSSTRS